MNGRGLQMAALSSSPSLAFFSSSISRTFTDRNLNRLSISTRPKSVKPSRIPTLSIRSEMAILPVISFEGNKIGETYLDLRIARPETARAVVHRAIVTELRNKRRGTASTKTRGEVRGGGRKPYPQKGTGRARRGSQRTPLRRGGGVIFGPKPKDWSIKINRKEKKIALATALWSAAVDSIVLEDFGDKFDRAKTKDFLAAMKRWDVDPMKKSMFFLTKVSDNVRLSSRNINTMKMLTPNNLNMFDILNSDKLVYTQASVDYLNAMYPSKRREMAEEEDEGDVVDQDGDEEEGEDGKGVLDGGEEGEGEGGGLDGDGGEVEYEHVELDANEETEEEGLP